MAIIDQFPVVNTLIHLNHAAVGPWPRVASDRLKAFAEENTSQGSLDYSRWLKTEQTLRQDLARLIHADVDEIALVKNTSEGLSLVAYGLPWKPGDNVVGILQEFPSNRFVWESLADKGVEFRKLDLRGQSDVEQSLMDLCDASTRLISISAVQYADGLRMDLARIGQFCRERGILFCVDGIQQIGSLPLDVQAVGADFVIADGHKWMLSAEGLALLYVRAEVMDRLSILQYGWHMAQHTGDYTRQDFTPAESARRFECGSPNMAGIYVMQASISLLLEVGMDVVGERVIDNSLYLIEKMSSLEGVDIISNTEDERISGIVTFSSRKRSADELYRLLGEHKVLCAPRGGGIRFSPHFYTPREQLQQVIDLLRDVAT